MIANQSTIRKQRGAAARVLLSLHEADQLAHSELWTWDVLDALPNWCLKDESEREALQLLCGALVLAPELRLWIDRIFILIAHDLIGKEQFDLVVSIADQAPIAIKTPASTRFKSAANEGTLKDSVRTIFLQAGASVLKATLSNDLLNEIFATVLGETAGDITEKLTDTIMSQAQHVLDDTKSAASNASACANGLSVMDKVRA